MHFHQMFSVGLPSEDIQFISFLYLFSNNCCCGNTSSDFWVLYIMDVPQTQLMHPFPPNFQDMLSTEGSRADQDLGSIQQQVLSWQHFKVFGVLKPLTSQEFKPLNAFSPNLQNSFTLRGSTIYCDLPKTCVIATHLVF